ncbi:MAG: HEAT repeat domain-containing protein [Planctomycetota bacterium]
MVDKQPKQQPPPASYADFDDGEKPPGWVRTVVQFFAIPLFIASVAVAIYLGINLMLGTGPKSAGDFVVLLQSDTINRRWQAAFELAARLGGPEIPPEFSDPKLVDALCAALESTRTDTEDPRLAELILHILARLQDPRALPAVRSALDFEHAWVRSHAIVTLAALGDHASVPRLQELAESDGDPKTRQVCLDALASLDQLEGISFQLSTRTRELALEGLGDAHEDVRFTSALILAHAGEKVALPVLRKMLDRRHLETFEFNDQRGGLDPYAVRSDTLLKAIQGALWLDCGDDTEVMQSLRRLTDDDVEGDFAVREAARQALTTLQNRE